MSISEERNERERAREGREMMLIAGRILCKFSQVRDEFDFRPSEIYRTPSSPTVLSEENVRNSSHSHSHSLPSVLSSFSFHSLLILFSFSPHSLFILSSFSPHSLLPLSSNTLI
jgi:hypothetical protein